MHGKPLVYLDSANTSQKPLSVIKATDDYYRHANANIHRATHLLSERATALYEGAREKAATFLNAADPHTIVLTKGTTDGINLVAQSYGRSVLKPGDEILLSWLEHHSNIVPWQLVAEQTGATIKVVPINDAGELDQDEYARLLSPRTKIVAVGHVSNALGTINPIKAMIAQAHAHGAVVLVDGAQAAPHLAIDVQDLDCDFYVLSSHKMFGPTGTGVLYGRKQLLEAMPPYQGGGDMISSVTFEKTLYNQVPYKFEAGTPNIAGVAGFGAAIDYLIVDRSRGRARARGRGARLRDRAGARDSRRAHHRRGAPQDRRAVVPARGRASARCRHDPRSAGHRGAHRPALRAAGDGQVLHPGDDSRLARRSTTRARTSTRWSRACTKCARCLRDGLRLEARGSNLRTPGPQDLRTECQN